MLRKFNSSYPVIGLNCYIDNDSVIIGDVTVGNESSIWPLAVARGDVNSITIGHRTNIQDGSVLHVTHKNRENPAGFPLVIGDDVTVGHKALLHGCTIGNRVLIGMGAIVMDGAIIENDLFLAAGSLVPPGKHLLSGFLYQGSPAKQIRKLSDEELLFLKKSAQTYMDLKNEYLAQTE